MQGYTFKYLCANCPTVYWGYKPRDEYCKECKRKALYRVDLMTTQEQKQSLDLSVNPNDLVAEWVRHVPMVLLWNQRLAESSAKLDVAKSKLELVRAEVETEIRDDPSQYGIDGRPTNDAINSQVLQQPEVKAATTELNDLKAKVGRAQAVVNALVDRKKQLSMLTELWMRDYYSDTELPEEIERQRNRRARAESDAD